MSLTLEAKNSEERWLNAAYSVLRERGVDAVKVLTLAKKAGLTRTGFYWHFKDVDELLSVVVANWENKNTGNIVASTEAYAETINEAIFNLFDCWFDPNLFDGPLDVAIRNWARVDMELKARLDRADGVRLNAMKAMFERFGYSDEDAEVRSLTIIYTQIGYISMEVNEDVDLRISRAAHYCEVFTGKGSDSTEIARFKAKHSIGKPQLKIS